MSRYRVTASAKIRAPAAQIYAVLADYRVWHPAILPPAYFHDLVVERGGTGEGTVIRFRMQVLGTSRTVRAFVTEPQPGRVLMETDLDTGAVTTFTVVAAADGCGTDVTIATALAARGGLLGAIERLLTTPLLRRIYRKELALLSSLHSTYGTDLAMMPAASPRPLPSREGSRVMTEPAAVGCP